MYKIIDDNSIEKIGVCIIPRDELNKDYQQFVADVVAIGTTCVEGADKVVTTPYGIARAVEYPSWQEQQDMQYWDEVNSTTVWKDHVAKVKSDNPKP